MLINSDYVHGHTPVIVLFSDRLERPQSDMDISEYLSNMP